MFRILDHDMLMWTVVQTVLSSPLFSLCLSKKTYPNASDQCNRTSQADLLIHDDVPKTTHPIYDIGP